MFLLPGLNSPFLFPASKVGAAALLLPSLSPRFKASGNCLQPLPQEGPVTTARRGQSPALCLRTVSGQPAVVQAPCQACSAPDSTNTHAGPGSRCCSSHFREETEALRRCLSSPRSRSKGRGADKKSPSGPTSRWMLFRAGGQRWKGLGAVSGHKLGPAPFSTRGSGWSLGAEESDQAVRKEPVLAIHMPELFPSGPGLERGVTCAGGKPFFQRKHEPLAGLRERRTSVEEAERVRGGRRPVKAHSSPRGSLRFLWPPHHHPSAQSKQAGAS